MPRELRIVAPRYGSDIVGGAENLLRQLAMVLTGSGWRVRVLTSCARDARTWRNEIRPGTSVEEGVRVERFAVQRPRHPARFHQLSRAFFRLPSPLRPEQRWIAAQGPHAPGLVAALASESPVPTLFHPYLYECFLAGVHAARGPRLLIPGAHDELPLRLRAVGRAIAACDGLLYGTPEEQTLLESVHPLARSIPHRVGSAGVQPPHTQDPDRFRAEHQLRGRYLLHGGRSVPGKGTEELVAAAALLHNQRPDTVLVLTGEAGERIGVAPGVVPVGRLSEGARWDALAGAAAVVVPSFQESLSLLTLEAWAVGRPTLLNLHSPALAGQLRRSGGGIGFTDVAGLVEAALRVLDNEGLATGLGLAGQAYVEREYRWEDVVGRITQLIEGAPAA